MGNSYFATYFLYDEVDYEMMGEVLEIFSDRGIEVTDEGDWYIREDQVFYRLGRYNIGKNYDYSRDILGPYLTNPTDHKLFPDFETLMFRQPPHSSDSNFDEEVEIITKIIQKTDPFFGITLNEYADNIKHYGNTIERDALENGEFRIEPWIYLSYDLINERSDFDEEDILKTNTFETKEINDRGIFVIIYEDPWKHLERIDEFEEAIGFDEEESKEDKVEKETEEESEEVDWDEIIELYKEIWSEEDFRGKISFSIRILKTIFIGVPEVILDRAKKEFSK